MAAGYDGLFAVPRADISDGCIRPRRFGGEHVMFDTDGDYDFSDETDYRLGEQPPLVRMAYERVVNKKIVPDITWVELSDRFGERNLLMWETT